MKFDWREDYRLCALCHALVKSHSPEECHAWSKGRPGPGAWPAFVRPEPPEPPLPRRSRARGHR